VWVEGRYGSVSQLPCPGCGRHDDINRVSFDPETWTIRG
jgi:hypothetical protein